MATKNKPESEEEKRARLMIEEIADNIAALSRSVSNLLDGRLKEKTIVILLAHTTKMQQYQVEKVLDALKNLEATHLKK